jgi:hypothetical protein
MSSACLLARHKGLHDARVTHPCRMRLGNGDTGQHADCTAKWLAKLTPLIGPHTVEPSDQSCESTTEVVSYVFLAFCTPLYVETPFPVDSTGF